MALVERLLELSSKTIPLYLNAQIQAGAKAIILAAITVAENECLQKTTRRPPITAHSSIKKDGAAVPPDDNP